MEAKDTIRLCPPTACGWRINCDPKCHNVQAEISFKAGYDKRDSEFVYNPDYLDFQKGVRTGRELGIREVLAWEEEHNVIGYVYDTDDPEVEKQNMIDWVKQLKEWEETDGDN